MFGFRQLHLVGQLAPLASLILWAVLLNKLLVWLALRIVDLHGEAPLAALEQLVHGRVPPFDLPLDLLDFDLDALTHVHEVRHSHSI